MASGSEHDELQRILPAYEIGPLIGAGAFGRVYQGWHRGLDRPVAVKALVAGDDPEMRRRFRDEARIVASLDHPHVLKVYDFDDHADICLLVMEYLAGGTFDAWRRSGITDQAIVAAVIQALRGLEHAHSHGILHRDVKPDNLLFSDIGVLKVSDFGIAKIVGGPSADVGATASQVVGTPAYMAPEQGRAGHLSPATDVYAVATVLYEALTDSLPFDGDGSPVGLLLARMVDDPIPLLERRPDAPAATAQVVMGALERDPARRCPDAATLARDLEIAGQSDFGAGWFEPYGGAVKAPVTESPPTGAGRAAASSEPADPRHRVVAGLLAGAVLVAVAGVVAVVLALWPGSNSQGVLPVTIPDPPMPYSSSAAPSPNPNGVRLGTPGAGALKVSWNAFPSVPKWSVEQYRNGALVGIGNVAQGGTHLDLDQLASGDYCFDVKANDHSDGGFRLIGHVCQVVPIQ